MIDMDFLSLAKLRCSVRDFDAETVEPEKLDYVLEAGRIAPSAVNAQPWFFVVIREEENRRKLQDCYNRDWFKTAPIYIVICGNHELSWKRSDGKDHCDIDIAIACQQICLAATEMNLATCWVCNFDSKKCKELFDLPPHIEPIVLIPIGYPKDKSVFEKNKDKKRKPIAEIVKWDKFQ